MILTLAVCAYADVESSRDAIAQWIKTEQLISQEREEWEHERVMMEDMKLLMEAEIEQLDGQIQNLSESNRIAQNRRSELFAQEESSLEEREILKQRVVQMQRSLVAFYPLLPKVLQQQYAVDFNKIDIALVNQDPQILDTLQRILTVLEGINAFNQTITVVTELHTLPDGRVIEVEVIYMGLAGAYFVNKTGDFAGRLLPTAEGWKIELQAELAADIEKAIASHRKTIAPVVVELPVNLLQQPVHN